MASGLDDICGKLKNSSRSIVPELSYNKERRSELLASGVKDER